MSSEKVLVLSNSYPPEYPVLLDVRGRTYQANWEIQDPVGQGSWNQPVTKFVKYTGDKEIVVNQLAAEEIEQKELEAILEKSKPQPGAANKVIIERHYVDWFDPLTQPKELKNSKEKRLKTARNGQNSGSRERVALPAPPTQAQVDSFYHKKEIQVLLQKVESKLGAKTAYVNQQNYLINNIQERAQELEAQRELEKQNTQLKVQTFRTTVLQRQNEKIVSISAQEQEKNKKHVNNSVRKHYFFFNKKQQTEVQRLYKSIQDAVEHILAGGGEEKFQRIEEVIKQKEHLNVDYLKDQKNTHDAQHRLQLFQDLRLLLSKRTDELQVLHQIHGDDFLSVISLARDLSESGAASETGSVASQSLDVLKDHLERKTNEDPKLVKFYDIKRLKDQWGLVSEQKVKESIRRVLVREALSEAEHKKSRQDREEKERRAQLEAENGGPQQMIVSAQEKAKRQKQKKLKLQKLKREKERKQRLQLLHSKAQCSQLYDDDILSRQFGTNFFNSKIAQSKKLLEIEEADAEEEPEEDNAASSRGRRQLSGQHTKGSAKHVLEQRVKKEYFDTAIPEKQRELMRGEVFERTKNYSQLFLQRTLQNYQPLVVRDSTQTIADLLQAQQQLAQ